MEKARINSLSWDDDTVYAFGLYRLIGRGLGNWPLTCHEFGSKIQFFMLVILQVGGGLCKVTY